MPILRQPKELAGAQILEQQLIVSGQIIPPSGGRKEQQTLLRVDYREIVDSARTIAVVYLRYGAVLDFVPFYRGFMLRPVLRDEVNVPVIVAPNRFAAPPDQPVGAVSELVTSNPQNQVWEP